MTRHLVVLGAGFGGLELVTRLSDAAVDDLRITLIDQADSFVFGFSKLDVMVGQKQVDEVRLYYKAIVRPGVDCRQERIERIDPTNRTVTTSGGTYEADILVVALGADYDFSATPGFAESGYE